MQCKAFWTAGLKHPFVQPKPLQQAAMCQAAVMVSHEAIVYIDTALPIKAVSMYTMASPDFEV